MHDNNFATDKVNTDNHFLGWPFQQCDSNVVFVSNILTLRILKHPQMCSYDGYQGIFNASLSAIP